MVKLPVVMLAVGLGLVAGCKAKDKDNGLASGSGSAGAGSGAPVAGSAGSAVVETAAGSAVGDLPVVSDCPKSLSGAEKVARTIKKECGPIAVTGEYEVNGSLTLEAGVVLKFAPDAKLSVGYNDVPAKLFVKGGDAPDQRVVFTSGGDKAPGVWRGVELYGGADRSQITGLDIEYAGTADGAALRLRGAIDVRFTKSSVKHARNLGLEAIETSTFSDFSGNTFDDIAKIAVAVEPVTVGTLGAGNTFAKDAFVEIRGGKVPTSATWKNIGAPYHVADEVSVETASTPTTLTLADVTLVFDSGASLAIGYSSKGKLVVTGPATFTSAEAKPGSWKGVWIYTNGEATIDNATFIGGGRDDGGALTGKQGAVIALGAVTFKDSKYGLWLEDGVNLSGPKVLAFSGNDKAARLWAGSFGALGTSNVYADGQIVEIGGGKLTADTTWSPQAKASVQVLDEVSVGEGHTLTIAGGATYAWKPGVELVIGYSTPGTLKVVGTAAAPVVMSAITKGDTWNGVKLYAQSRASAIAYLELSDVSSEGGVFAKSGAAGKLDHVTCARCAATFASECGAKVELTAVTAGAETKVSVVTPTGC